MKLGFAGNLIFDNLQDERGSVVREFAQRVATLEPNRRRYESWVRLYAPRLYRFAYRLSGHHQVAEDLIQETFLEAWRGIDNLKEEERALGWLFQILRFRHAHFCGIPAGKGR